jgi:GDPmannose 4,6-dehydratase
LGKAIIFGANGQDGYYLSELLRLNKVEVISISRTFGSISGDVSDFNFVESAIKVYQPNYVFHFAANSTTSHSALIENHSSISSGTLNILEAVRKYSPKTKVFISGSALQFKNDGNPINECTPFEASSSYSAERIYSAYLTRYYREKFNLNSYIGYLFNHDSPLRNTSHINQKIIMSAINIAAGKQEKLIIGDVNVMKEFNYAGDIVSAIWSFICQDEISEIVIGSGKAFTIKNWIEYCFKKVGLNWEEHVVKDEKYTGDYKVLVSDPTLLNSIGYKPTKDIFQLADMMLKSALDK